MVDIKIMIVDVENLLNVSKALSGIKILHGDFTQVLDYVDEKLSFISAHLIDR